MKQMIRKIMLIVVVLLLCNIPSNKSSAEDNFYNIWRSGNYDALNGSFYEYSCRISYLDYVPVQENSSVNIEISDTQYHVLLRELDTNKTLISSKDIGETSSFELLPETRYMAVTVYCPGNTDITYEDFHNAFQNGLVINVNASELETIPANIEEELDAFYRTWRSGNFDLLNGSFYEYPCRISYLDYVAVTENTSLAIEISDNSYHVLLRELDENKGLINSRDIGSTCKFDLLENTRFIAVTVYCPGNTELTYEDFHNAFINGLVIDVKAQPSDEKKDEVVLDQQIIENDPVVPETVETVTNQFVADSVTPSEGAMDFAKKMGAGWNLGNALLCCNGNVYSASTADKYTPKYYETLWGNLYTTQSMIKTVKDAGFNTVRVPVTYRNHIDGNYQVDQAWLARVKEVVDYVVSQNMYCIINLHHENWLIADASCQNANSQELAVIWTQIANYFAGYDEHLIFEGFNEVINSKGQWDSADTASYQAVNLYNQTFVNAVRATGGKNANRYLLVNTYAAKATQAVISGFVLPTDTVKDRLLVGVHVYDGIRNIPSIMERLNNTFVSKGIPVVIGEWGLVNNSTNTTTARVNYVNQYISEAKKYGIVCVWWDDGCGSTTKPSEVYNYALLCRKNATWYFPEIVNAITSYYK